jgi:hypothetical protein
MLTLRKLLPYLSYVVRHKFFVAVECIAAGLWARGILHDLSKFLPSEFFPYANYFYGRKVRDSSGYYKPTDTGAGLVHSPNCYQGGLRSSQGQGASERQQCGVRIRTCLPDGRKTQATNREGRICPPQERNQGRQPHRELGTSDEVSRAWAERRGYGRFLHLVFEKVCPQDPCLKCVCEKFDFAWLLHQKRNRHHWQWWILPEDGGGVKVLEMSRQDTVEMVCDWRGAARAQKSKSPDPRMSEVQFWWTRNNHKMQLHPRTRRRIELILALTRLGKSTRPPSLPGTTPVPVAA